MSGRFNLRQYKTNLRRRYRSIRKKMSAESKSVRDASILDKIVSMREYRQCRTLLCYVSKDEEIDTLGLIRRALADGKTVAVPRCTGKPRDMLFHIIDSPDVLAPASYGILEPPEHCPVLRDFANSICIVPAIAFDHEGYRIGYGGGYYDSFLSGPYNGFGLKIGVSYVRCLCKSFIHGRYDVPCDILVTEKMIRAIDAPAIPEKKRRP